MLFSSSVVPLPRRQNLVFSLASPKCGARKSSFCSSCKHSSRFAGASAAAGANCDPPETLPLAIRSEDPES
ncbi:hypothetical protein CWO90_42205 [Bradyrhizobium sp. Leo121]|nr:hypothetical protein CWO90_42205 [Bradyrhizobium sp. Leo121]